MTSRVDVYNLLKELKCATALEIATRLGASRKAVQMCLNRLAAKGLVERRAFGRAVMYCAKDNPGDGPTVERRNAADGNGVHERGGRRRRSGALYTATQKRLPQVLQLLERYGCVSVGALMRALGVTHTKAYHVTRVLLLLHKGVKVLIGRTAILCRDRAAAEETVARLRETIHRLAVESGMRYVTAPKVLQAALRDRDAYTLLSRFIPLKRNAERFPPVALTFVKDILQSLYGEQLRCGNKAIYVVSQPRQDYVVNITDSVETHVVRVNLPDDIATALHGVADVNEVVLHALEQLLARYRT
jgi:biotin operon repressor